MRRFLFFGLLLLLTHFTFAGDDDKAISVYPVPLKTENILYIKLDNNLSLQARTIELRNFIGKVMQSKSIKGAKEIAFEDMSQYPNGVYMVVVKDLQQKIIESAKFVINK